MRLVTFATVALLGSALSASTAAAQSCQLQVINVHVENDQLVADPDKACVCNGGWVVWLVENTREYKINVKIRDWKDSHNSKADDVVKFKKFGVFDDGSDEDVDGVPVGFAFVKTVAFVARAQKEGTFHYALKLKKKGVASTLDPQLEIKRPGGLKGTVCPATPSGIQ